MRKGPRSSLKDISGQRFGRLTVVEYAGSYRSTHSLWRCKCDCGVCRVVLRQSLTSGRTLSCGCLGRERHTRHGMLGTPEYRIWSGMICRCHSVGSRLYHKYGAKGIRVCARWRHSFRAFYDDMGPRPRGRFTIDRIDGRRGYSPANCRWATYTTQNRNRRSNVWITVGGRSRLITDWSRMFGVAAGTIRSRLGRGWPAERAVKEQPKARRAPTC